jgi:hypothetical protein
MARRSTVRRAEARAAQRTLPALLNLPAVETHVIGVGSALARKEYWSFSGESKVITRRATLDALAGDSPTDGERARGFPAGDDERHDCRKTSSSAARA